MKNSNWESIPENLVREVVKEVEGEKKEKAERLEDPMGGKILVCEKPFGGFNIGDAVKTRNNDRGFSIKLFDLQEGKLVKGENWITVSVGGDFEDFSNSFVFEKEEENSDKTVEKKEKPEKKIPEQEEKTIKEKSTAKTETETEGLKIVEKDVIVESTTTVPSGEHWKVGAIAKNSEVTVESGAILSVEAVKDSTIIVKDGGEIEIEDEVNSKIVRESEVEVERGEKREEIENNMYKQLYEKLDKEFNETNNKEAYLEKLKRDLEKFTIGDIDQEDEEFLESFGFNIKDKKNGRIILESYEKVVSKILDELNDIEEIETKAREEAEAVKEDTVGKIVEEEKIEIEPEPETIEGPEIKVEQEKEPKTTREVIEQLGLLEELEVFERILTDKERDLAEIENYINNKKRSGEEITQEDEDRRNKASEEVQRADINVNTARGVGVSLEVEKDAKDEMRILEKKIEMQNLLLTQFKVLEKIKGIEDKNIEKLNPKKKRVAKRFIDAVADKLPKRFTNKGGGGGGGEQMEESKKGGRLEWLQNLVERKLFGNSAESENSELKNAVAVELLRIADNDQLFKKFEGNEGKKIEIKDIEDEDVEEIIKNLPDKFKDKQGIKDEIKNLRFKIEYLKEVMEKSGDEDIIENPFPIEEIEPIKTTEETPEIEISETEEVSEEIKVAIRKGLVKLKERDRTVFDNLEGFINSFLSSEESFGNDLSKAQFNSFIKGDMDLEYEDIENIKTNDFLDTLREIYNEVKEEEDVKTGKEDEKEETGESMEEIKKDIESRIEIGIGKIGDDKVKEFQKDLKNKLVDDRNVLYERGLRMFEEIGIDYNDIKEIDANWLIETLGKACDKEIKMSENIGKDKKETGEITEEMKLVIKKNLETMNKKDLGDIKLRIDAFLSRGIDENMELGDVHFMHEYPKTSKGIIDLFNGLGINHGSIENIKVKEFLKELKKIYNEIEKEK